MEEYPKIMRSDSSDICVHCYNVEIDPELKLINTKPMIKNIPKES